MIPQAALAICASLVILTGRWLTIRYLAIPTDGMDAVSDAEQEAAIEAVMTRCASVPVWISTVYNLGVLGLLVVVIWSVVTIAWWTLVLALPLWVAVHYPWRAQFRVLIETNRIIRRTAQGLTDLQGE